ncbi:MULTISPECIES: DUF1801 domain-containing protein [unclassified Isoptericola]|uniref:DUF1801 domain-containing protein n=1 Tax=unclassified Isoptericola TaxID=2623355 RepID=UPI0027139101|nr:MULTISPECIES: DUF1801 domain-containing protein [unclassified Isoptericola]MDO8145393.1 hypothetical protein [Isoptericola sp. 178]MDO8151026.1 hypothetical protein [Isoptericola sp. b408]
MRRTAEDVDAYLHGDDVAPDLARTDAVVRDVLPGLSRSLWRGVFWGGTEQVIIGYGDIVQPRPRGADVEWFLVGLAQQKRHLSLYVNAVEDGAYLGRRYADRLGRAKVGAASISFARLDDLDEAVLREMLAHAGRTLDEGTPPTA